jgi:phosphoserine phosphatase RsbU/P
MSPDAMVVDVSQDWLTACEVQQRFMQPPAAAFDTLSYSAQCRQVRALGGDCYHFISLPQNRLALAVGDASGKSVAAALVISGVQSSLRTAASFAGDDPAAVVSAVNRQVCASSLPSSFATLFYGVFDPATCTLQYVNAGHNPVIIIRHDGSTARLEATGLPLGIFPDSQYSEAAIQLRPGDLLLAYTDGVVESRNPAGEEWGLDGLCAATAENRALSADDLVQAIFNSMDEFSHSCQHDDATLAAIIVH